ncbi:DUF4192 family protein [Modestobacter sp. I12A-02628]|uniref:DUF4192 domain-containing protein n=1 Tax=Goekera deserti TaxID=2497753 RepID=A0A7K3WI79_9ACTN|nr:DUF4192 domain-containing protein [Goekera deserti]MPQ96722.1 DUF4192 family protein [Goekera deserti]NDI46964.1 DUF4192 family protein [Goekera deserti]NEL56201.1 DUF4192 domain-containing protein [Goekera deserti]
MSPDEQFRVRLGDPGDLARALPHLIGFPPRESLVLVSLTGPGSRRVGMTVRADLPPEDALAEVARSAVRGVLTHRPSAVVVLVVSEDPDVPADVGQGPGGRPVPGTDGLPHRLLVAWLTGLLDRAGVAVPHVLLVRRGRWWSYDCPEPCCHPSAGTALPGGTSALAAASAVVGQVVEADREALVRRIAPVGPPAAAGMSAACREVGAAHADRLADVGPEAVGQESWQLLRSAVRSRQDGAPPSSDAAAARQLWGLRDVLVRDRAMTLALGPVPEAAEALWTELTRRAPAPLDAAPATLLAVSAWLRGDGAMASIALDRALDSEPGYSLALLLRRSLDAALPPAAVRELITDAMCRLDDAG